MQGVHVQYLVGKLRSHMPCGQKTKKHKRYTSHTHTHTQNCDHEPQADSLCLAVVFSLPFPLRSHMPCGQKTKKHKRYTSHTHTHKIVTMNHKRILYVWQLFFHFPSPFILPVSYLIILHQLHSFQNSNISFFILTFSWWPCFLLSCQNCSNQMRTYIPSSICTCILYPIYYHGWISHTPI